MMSKDKRGSAEFTGENYDRLASYSSDPCRDYINLSAYIGACTDMNQKNGKAGY